MRLQSDIRDRSFLGIEGGATRTVALLANGDGIALRRREAGPANLRLMTDAELVRHFRSLAAALPRPDALGIGLAGVREKSDCNRIRSAAAKAWPNTPCGVANDLETALIAAADRALEPVPQVLIISGTGSGCYGHAPGGKTARVGGWGHLLGDKGSGYDIGLQALQALADTHDRTGTWPKLGERILSALELNEPIDLVGWAQRASKTEIANLAIEVFAARKQGDKLAAAILSDAAIRLARDAAACARRLAQPRNPVQFVLAGSVLLKQPQFATQVGRELRRLWPKARVTPLKREGVWGAVELAKRAFESKVQSPKSPAARDEAPPPPMVRSERPSPTEGRNPRSMNLDKLPVVEAITLMLSEDVKIPGKLLAERRHIERVVQILVRAFRRGGRLFYVGAGTSGRLGVLDASECPPTFRVSPEMVQGIIAGGQTALWKSVEGAEDDAEAGRHAIGFRNITGRDVVVGIAASGTTPFVWGALAEAKRRRATTVLLCFNPYLKIPRALRPSVVIAPNLGPEVLTGSTRLKAGTATKLLLNIFTTLAMLGLGKVKSNLMIDLNPSNVKLRDRAVRIVRELTQADYAAAQAALERSGWVVKKAVARLGRS